VSCGARLLGARFALGVAVVQLLHEHATGLADGHQALGGRERAQRLGVLRRKRLGLRRKQLAAVHIAALGQRLAALQRDHLLGLRGGGGVRARLSKG